MYLCVCRRVFDVHTNRNTTEARGIRAPKSAVLNLWVSNHFESRMTLSLGQLMAIWKHNNSQQ